MIIIIVTSPKIVLVSVFTHRPLSSSFLGLPSGILHMNYKKELLRGLWVQSPAPLSPEILSLSPKALNS